MSDFNQALNILIKTEETKTENIDQQLQNKYEQACNLLQINETIINSHLQLDINDSNIRWKYISLLFYILVSIDPDETKFSINFLTDIKKSLQFIISLGLLPNLLPGIRVDVNKRCKSIELIKSEPLSIPEQYYHLIGTVRGLLKCYKLRVLRNYIVANYLNDLLAALLQLVYAPVKKPENSSSEFVMSREFYDEIIRNRIYFQEQFNLLLKELPLAQLFQEFMYFYGSVKTGRWLKVNVYKILINQLQKSNGVESLLRALNISETYDTGTDWKQIQIIVKLLLTKPESVVPDDYYQNICTQILKLTNTQIIASSIEYFYQTNRNDCKNYLLNPVLGFFEKYSKNSNQKFESKTSVEKELEQTVSIINLCFIEKTVPVQLFRSYVLITFHFYVIINKSGFCNLNEEMRGVLVKFLNESDENLFDLFIFDSKIDGILQIKPNLKFLINENQNLEISVENLNIRLDPNERSDCLFDLITKYCNNNKIIVSFCLYLLESATEENFKTERKSGTDLLHLENENTLVLDSLIERKLISYRLLSKLVEDKKVCSFLKREPKPILNFIEATIANFHKTKLHKSENYDSNEFQTLFLLIIIIDTIVNDLQNTEFKSLKNILKLISIETKNTELKFLIQNICMLNNKNETNEKGVYEKAIEDVCDPLLPIRGHGLLTLAKLLEEKAPEIRDKQQYILNICQHNIKCDDSYIYLNTIRLLVALVDYFPDTILNVLTDEYVNGTKELFENDAEVRMKLGEVLIRVVRALGESVSKYKSLLLNTFLSGIRDEDHLIRASSLSNLGELCQVLGYKIGSVITEILSCIHSTIATDKSVETRRAAVSVLRSLFVGLHKETIVILKDEILPIYRTLKDIYSNDPDEITRLQAQLALEELNENVKSFVFPHVKLFEKKIVMLQ